MRNTLVSIVALLAALGGTAAEEKPIVYGRVFACGQEAASINLWLFVEEDQDAHCKTVAPGRFECHNGTGSRAYGTCEIGCVQTEGYSGCLTLTDEQLIEFRDRLPREPIFSVGGRTADGNIEENCVLIPSREDSHCWVKTLGRSVVGGACGSVKNGEMGSKTWSPLVAVDVYGSHCNCGDLECDSLDQRNCAMWPLLLRIR